MSDAVKKRKVIHSEGRAIIAKVFHFLKEEYNFMKENNYDQCDLSLLANVRKRTALATGVSERTITSILKEEKEGLSSTNEQRPKRTKGREELRKRAIATGASEPAITVLKEERDFDMNPLANLRKRTTNVTRVNEATKGSEELRKRAIETGASESAITVLKEERDFDLNPLANVRKSPTDETRINKSTSILKVEKEFPSVSEKSCKCELEFIKVETEETKEFELNNETIKIEFVEQCSSENLATTDVLQGSTNNNCV